MSVTNQFSIKEDKMYSKIKGWKKDFFEALFPIDERVMALPYFLKGRRSNREKVDKMFPDRKKPDLDLAENIILKHLPQRLYKYRCFDKNEYAISNFVNDTLWISHPSTFNDPFDSISRNDTNLLDELFMHLTNKNIINEKDANDLRKINQIMSMKVTQNAYLVGSLSESNDSTLMWSHYADSHKGFCIGYDSSEIYNSNVIQKRIYPILYTDFNNFPYEDSALGLDYSGLFSVLRKSLEWEYEKEWRIVFSCYSKPKPGNIQLPKAKAVYLGANILENHKKQIIDIATKKQIDIFVGVANVLDGKINFTKL